MGRMAYYRGIAGIAALGGVFEQYAHARGRFDAALRKLGAVICWAECSGAFLTPSPPADQAAAHEPQRPCGYFWEGVNRMFGMRRREFITLLGSAALAWPLAVRAQVRRPLVGYLAGAASSSVVGSTSKLGFINGLREHGYVVWSVSETRR
jgi:hypothetical protein